jgi:uridine phosphorylase
MRGGGGLGDCDDGAVPRHLRPTAPTAPRALLPGDPKRAMELANRLLARPVMSNLSRGLWGYHGVDRDGLELTVQSTGLGGPSAAIVLTELAELGVARAIRVGTCRALDPGLAPGDTIVAEGALVGDGVSSALVPAAAQAPADRALTAGLVAATKPRRVGLVASTDLYYDDADSADEEWRRQGAMAIDLSAAAVLAAGRRAGLTVACVLVVAESAAGERLAGDDLDNAALALGERAAGAFEGAAQASPEGVSPS